MLARARHVASEVERTFRARAALERGDLAAFGECLTGAHASLRDLYEVSIPELDFLVDTAVSWDGCLGSRLTGAGFGGCTVAVLRSDAREGFAEHLEEAYLRRFGRRPPVEFFQGDGGRVSWPSARTDRRQLVDLTAFRINSAAKSLRRL